MVIVGSKVLMVRNNPNLGVGLIYNTTESSGIDSKLK